LIASSYLLAFSASIPLFNATSTAAGNGGAVAGAAWGWGKGAKVIGGCGGTGWDFGTGGTIARTANSRKITNAVAPSKGRG